MRRKKQNNNYQAEFFKSKFIYKKKKENKINALILEIK